jgi:hypothetical protein
MRRGIPSSLATALLPPIVAPPGMPMPRARRRSLAPPSPLAELTWPKERRLDPDVALPACTRSQGALACSCVPRARIDSPPVQLTSSPTAYGQTPSASPPHKTAATAASLLRLAARVSTPALPPRRAVTSLPLPLRRPRCPHIMLGYKRGSYPCILFMPPPLPSSGKLSPLHRLCFPPLRWC